MSEISDIPMNHQDRAVERTKQSLIDGSQVALLKNGLSTESKDLLVMIPYVYGLFQEFMPAELDAALRTIHQGELPENISLSEYYSPTHQWKASKDLASNAGNTIHLLEQVVSHFQNNLKK